MKTYKNVSAHSRINKATEVASRFFRRSCFETEASFAILFILPHFRSAVNSLRINCTGAAANYCSSPEAVISPVGYEQ
jgi:hypothetical protein